jgi:ribonuclease H / adenosylcobalamin/alpha-ribazole phosphatase
MDAVERGRSGSIRRAPADAYETETDATTVPAGPRPAVVGWGPDIGAPTVTLIVRHGVTQHSLERRFSGSGGPFDPPLVAQGIAQAEAAAGEVAARGGGDVLVSSPMLRTRETAAILGARIGLEPIVLPGLEEGRFGDWDGLTFAEVMAGWPNEMSAWLSSPDVGPPGGESLTQVCARVWTALDQLLAEHPGRRIIIAGHVGTIRALTVRALGAPLSAMNRMELAPASLTTLTWYADGNASMRSFAESSHLDGVGSAWTP